MKKIIAMLMMLVLVVSMAACAPGNTDNTTTQPTTTKAEVKVMTYAEYAAAALDSEVTIEAYVQATQSWWEDEGQGKLTLYTQDQDGAYFIYEMPCTQEEAARLVPGTKIRVTGFKSDFSGEIEIADVKSWEILEGSFIAEPIDLTADFADKAKLEEKMNMLVCFKGATVAASKDADGNDVAFLYKWNGSGTEGDDLYFNVTIGETTRTFCVESYLCGVDTEVYQAVKNLQVGATIDLEGFMYWYDAPQLHVTAVTVK